MADDTNIISEPSKRTTFEDTIDHLKAEIIELKQQMELQMEEKNTQILEMQEHITTLETTTTPIHNKKRKFSNGKLDEEGVNEELNNLRNENEELKRRIEDLEQSSRQPEITTHAETQAHSQESKLVNLIDEKLGDGFNQIHSNLEKLISTKLEVIFSTEQTRDKSCNIICRSSW